MVTTAFFDIIIIIFIILSIIMIIEETIYEGHFEEMSKRLRPSLKKVWFSGYAVKSGLTMVPFVYFNKTEQTARE